jgi:hydroxysqualene dehydroxylase
MMNNKRIIVMGGGLSGISSSVYLSKAGFEVTLLESTGKLGGRTFSFYDEETGLTFDNGQHIMAGWYRNTLELIGLMNKEPKLKFNPNLEVYFRDIEGRQFEFHSRGDNPFVAVAKGFIDYEPITFKDKLHLLALRELIELDVSERLLKGRNLEWLLGYLKQTENLKRYFWYPFTYAVFNTSPKYVDAVVFLNVLVRAFEKFGDLSLIVPDEPLGNIFIEPFLKYAEGKIDIRTNACVKNISIKDGSVKGVVLENGEEITGDYYISAVPFHNFKNIIDTDNLNKYFNDLSELVSASIVSIYIVPVKMPDKFSEKFYHGMVGMLDTKVHWLFFKKDYICVIISAPEYTVEGYDSISKENLIDIVTEEIRSCFPEFRDMQVKRTKYFKEKRATFLPTVESGLQRPESATGLKNLFIAGDWTNTGIPATIEGAVTSGKKCSDLIKEQIERKQ